MDKDEKEYVEKYGGIPESFLDRIDLLLKGNFSKYRGTILNEVDRILHIEWKTVNIIVNLVPKSTPRPRYSGTTHSFYVKGAADNRKRFRKFMEESGLEPILTPMKISITSYLPIPSGMNKLEKLLAEMRLIRPISKPDWDNLGKTYSDMIQEKLILDDALIIEGISRKFYSLKPRIEVSISYMTEFDSVYNEDKIDKMMRKD